jgi:hypothetical protein
MELVDNSEPDGPKTGRLLAAVEYALVTSIMENGDARDRGKDFLGL